MDYSGLTYPGWREVKSSDTQRETATPEQGNSVDSGSFKSYGVESRRLCRGELHRVESDSLSYRVALLPIIL